MQGSLPNFQLNATVRVAFMPDSTLEFLPIISSLKCTKSSIFSDFLHSLQWYGPLPPLRALWHKQDFHCCKHDFQIFDNARMRYVHQIHSQFVVRSSIGTCHKPVPYPVNPALACRRRENSGIPHSTELQSQALRTGADDGSSHPSRYL